MQNKWLSRKLWMSIITVAATLAMTYLGKQELTEQTVSELTKILDAVFRLIELTVPAAVLGAMDSNKNGSAPK